MFERLARVVSRSAPPASSPADDMIAPQPAPQNRLVEVVVYSEDCILSGQLRLNADRLSDMLNVGDGFELTDVLVNDRTGGREWELRSVELQRDDILLVHAGGPRGNPGRRHRTRQHPIVAKAGPYAVRGYVHSLPGTDAIASLRRRKPMIALTDAVIEYTVRSTPQERRAGVLIINRDATDWIVEGHVAEIVMPQLPVDTKGALVKDFTGQIFDVDADWNG